MISNSSHFTGWRFLIESSRRSLTLCRPHILFKSVAFTLLAHAAAVTPLPAAEGMADTMDQRAKLLIDAALNEPNVAKPNNPIAPWIAIHHLSRGETKQGLELLYKILDGTPPPRQGHPFSSYALAYAYLKYGHLYDEAHIARWKELVHGREPYSYNLLPYPQNYSTTNLRLSGSTTWYLSSVSLGLENLPQGHIPKDGDPTRNRFLNRALDKIARTGVPEYASRPYGIVNMVPILCLAEQQADPDLARKAAVVYEAALASIAPNWLGGHWVVSTGRSYGDILSQSTNSNINFLWMYFGGLPNDARPGGMPSAVLPYRPPGYLVDIARNKAEPFVATSRFSWEKDDNPVVGLNPPDFLQYTYFNKTYGIFSQITKPGAVLQEQQIYPNGVMWDDPSGAPSFLWATIPAPAYAHTAGQIDRGLEFIQREGAWLMVGKPRAIEKNHYIQTFIPAGWHAMLDDASKDGRVYLAYKSVLIALSLPEPFTWSPDEPYFHQGQTGPGKDLGHRGFRYAAKPLALAMDTLRPDQAQGSNPAEKLEWFRNKVRAETKISLKGETARYQSLGGHLLERAPGTDGLVNGQTFDPAREPFLKNPWMFQPYQQDMREPCKLTISYEGKTHVYDLRNFKISHHDGPARPTHLIASPHAGKVELRWSPGPGKPHGFRIQRASGTGDSFAEIAKTADPQWVDSSVNDGTAYQYVVTAVNSGGESPASDPVSITPGPGIPPNPAGLTTVSRNAQVELSWAPTQGATSYRVLRATTPGGPYTALETPKEPRMVDSTAHNHTSYWYVVTATGPGGESGHSNEDMALPKQEPPSPPADLKVSRTQMKVEGNTVPAIRVTWSPVPGALQYNVGLSSHPASLFGNYGTISDGKTEWIIPEETVIKRKIPWCRVGAVNGSGGNTASTPINLHDALGE